MTFLLSVFAFVFGGLVALGRLLLTLAFGSYTGWRGFPRWRQFWASELGAVTVVFQYPIAGAVAPTAAQMALLSMLTATVQATADADTTAVVTHNMALTAAQLAFGFPLLTLTMLINFTAAAFPAWAATVIGANSVTLTKNAAVGSGNAAPQLQVNIQRPNTLVQ